MARGKKSDGPQPDTVWKTIVENAPDIIMTVDRGGEILYLNRTLTGATVEDVVGTSVYDYVPPDHHDALRASLERVFQAGEAGSCEVAGDGPHGAASWYQTRIGPIEEDGRVVAAVLISTDITGRKQAEEALEEQRATAARLADLSRVSQAVMTSLETEQVLGEIISLIGEVTGADFASLALVDEEGSLVFPEGVADANLPDVPDMEERIRAEGYTAWVVRSRRAAVVDDVGEDGAVISQTPEDAPGTLNPHLFEAGVRSLAGLPLMAQDRLLGVLFLHSFHPGHFRGQLPLLNTLSDQAAIAVENARLFEDTQTRLRQVSFLSEVSAAAISSLELAEVLVGIAERMAGFFEVGHCGIVIRQPGGERMSVAAEYPDRGAVGIEVATEGYPVAELVMQQGQVLAIEDAQNDPRMGPEQEWARELDVRSSLFIPLIAQDQVIGSIGLDAVGEPRRFTGEEIALARAVAAQIGMAVQNARLFASIESQMEERERLQQELIEAQQRAIRELSTPIIPIFERVIAMPLIGSIDTMRVRDIMRRLLDGIDRYQARVVILDVTGVSIIDTSVADYLNKTIQAARLKGVHTIVTGIGNEVASTVVELGIDWSRVDTLGDLQTGLAAALQRLGFRLEAEDE